MKNLESENNHQELTSIVAFDLAKELLQKGEYKTAIYMYEKIIAGDGIRVILPELSIPRAYCGLGDVYTILGKAIINEPENSSVNNYIRSTAYMTIDKHLYHSKAQSQYSLASKICISKIQDFVSKVEQDEEYIGCIYQLTSELIDINQRKAISCQELYTGSKFGDFSSKLSEELKAITQNIERAENYRNLLQKHHHVKQNIENDQSILDKNQQLKQTIQDIEIHISGDVTSDGDNSSHCNLI